MEGGEWSNFNAAVCVNEEADFMAQLFPNSNHLNYGQHYHHHNYHHHDSNNNNVEGGSSYYSSDSTSNSQNVYCYSQENSLNNNSNNRQQVHYHNYFSDTNHHDHDHHMGGSNGSSLPIDFLHCQMEEDQNGMNNVLDLNEDQSEMDAVAEDKSYNNFKSKKRPKNLDVNQKGKRNVRAKRCQSSLSLASDDDEEEHNGGVVHGQSSSSGSLEDDCNSKGNSTTTATTATATTTTALNSNGKTRASRGSATDPQSLYARAVLWNMDTLQTKSTPEDHTLVITDVRFRPNSTHLATASFDGSVRLWDASNPSYCLNVYPGRGTHVMSLDFHPKTNDLFCFCDSNSEIHYWSTSPFSCMRMSKGGTAQVRFQPRVGQLLAAASDNHGLSSFAGSVAGKEFDGEKEMSGKDFEVVDGYFYGYGGGSKKENERNEDCETEGERL